MEGNNGFSLYEQVEYTNQVLEISYTPKSSITRYTYEVMKDGEVYAEEQISGSKTSEIWLQETGEYQIVVTLYRGRTTETVTSGIYKIDREKPIIELKDTSRGSLITLEKPKKNTTYDLRDYILAYDKQDGDLQEQVTFNTIDFTKKGIQELIYTVSDSAGNVTTKTVQLEITSNSHTSLLSIQLLLLLLIVLILFKILRYHKSIKLEKRLAKYSVQGVRNHSISVVEKGIKFCQKCNQKIAKGLSKSVFLKKYSRHYEKYIPLYHPFYQSGMDAIATKLISGLGFICIAIFAMAIQFHMFASYELLIPFLFGFFLPDILFFSKYKLYRNTLENDLLQAIIIMNNAFKSGRSIRQAIDLVTRELQGPMAEEFKKMLLELDFGLSVEETFRRFSIRVELEEVAYLTASLSILNRTGGNIIQVFSSIEKSLFNKKKLKLELASLTGSSKIIIYVLFIVPPLFILFISLINPTYFVPLYTTPLGLILCGIMLIIYICYIFVVRSIMKVRM